MKFLLWMICLVYFSAFLMIVNPVLIIIVFVIRLLIKQLKFIQRSCDWYVKNNIYPWQADKAIKVYSIELDAKIKEKANAVRRKQNT